MRALSACFFVLALVLSGNGASAAEEEETASFAIDTTVKVMSDQTRRGISDSLNDPGAKLSVEVAHKSGLIGLLEVSSVSKKEFTNSDGMNMTVAGGYRFGDPDRWHFGIGLAGEIFPGAGFVAPHAIDMNTGMPADFSRTTYNSMFAVLEVGYGPLEGRVLNVLSRTYRGADTGGVCGQMLATMPDPTRALQCYARGDQNSRGSWLFDLDYKYNLTPTTTLNLHGGYQSIKHFSEANFADFSLGITHRRWGFDWSADFVATRVAVRELYVVQDGDSRRRTDINKVVLSVARRF
ncbi:TorF family putative porin [Paraburkholderia sp. SIMBA_050]